MIKKIIFFLLAFNFFIILNSSPIAPPVEDPSGAHSHGMGGWSFSSRDTSA
ncbi:hypothetical protein ABH892_002140 [Paenibacillus sp. RC254]